MVEEWNTEVDFELAHKLPPEHRYRNISVLWIFYYPRAVRFFYQVGIRHEWVTLLSLACGIVSGLFLIRPSYMDLLLAAFFIHVKDVLDASDGSLARLTMQTNRIGRFLDSICDFLAITWLMIALAIRVHGVLGFWTAPLALAAWISTFIQCSYFNYYLVSYTKLYQKTNVRLDERMTLEDRDLYQTAWKRILLMFLQTLYGFVYGWQDRLIAAFDAVNVKKIYNKSPQQLDEKERREWYGDKSLMTVNSPLCFGTHIFVFILSALVNYPEYFFHSVIIMGNLYLFLTVAIRDIKIGRERGWIFE